MKKHKVAMEIGCGDRYSSLLVNRYEEFDKIYLIEPNNRLFKDIASAANPWENITVGNFAIGPEKKVSTFYDFGYASFLEEADSFLKLSCEENAVDFWKLFAYPKHVMTMDTVDLGDIDYLVLTNQGSEMFVLDKMVSRPSTIITKYYCHNAKHWEHYNKVTAWMAKNGYAGKLLDRNEHGTYLHIEFIKNENGEKL